MHPIFSGMRRPAKTADKRQGSNRHIRITALSAPSIAISAWPNRSRDAVSAQDTDFGLGKRTGIAKLRSIGIELQTCAARRDLGPKK
jgi:hypothetical protein